MKKWFKYIVIGLVVGACKLPQTQVSVQERALPESFKGGTDTSQIGNLSWRNYFSDPALQSLIDTALVNNLDKKMALERIQMAQAQVLAAKGAMLPTLSGNFSPALRRYGYYTMDGVGNATTDILPGKRVPVNLPDFYVGLQSTWEIDVWKKLSNRKKSAYQQFLASVEGVNYVQTQLVAEVASAYFELVALDHELSVLSETVKNQEEVLNVIRAQKEAARANELVVQQFKAQQLNTQTLERQVRQEISEVENRLNALLGRYPQPIVRSKDLLFKGLPKDISAGIPVQVLHNRPDIKAAALEVESKRLDVLSARAEFLPSIQLSAGIGYQAFNPKYLLETPTSLAYSLVGGLTAPLLNRKAIEARFSTAKSSQILALLDYHQALLNGYTEVLNELNRIEAYKDISDLKNEEVQVLQSSVQTSSELYTAAKATYLEVLVAQQNALQAQLDRVEAYKRQWLSSISLYKALGGGWK
jgi:multidrug efflux system outer membrane protein